MKSRHRKKSSPGALRDRLPDEHYHAGTMQASLTALCFVYGALVLQARCRSGLPVPRIGDIPFGKLISPRLSKSSIERIALRIAHDSGVGRVLREALADGRDLGVPALDAWVREARRTGDDPQQQFDF